MTSNETQIDWDFIEEVERAHFRTDEDTGANPCAMLVWNIVRKHAGLPPLEKSALPAFCVTHNIYHAINKEYGCQRKQAA